MDEGYKRGSRVGILWNRRDWIRNLYAGFTENTAKREEREIHIPLGIFCNSKNQTG